MSYAEGELATVQSTSFGEIPPTRSALSAYKLAIMLEGVYRRSIADPTRGEARAMGETVLRLVHEAQGVVDEAGGDHP